jgi:uncharacterized repeat protein (TIGR03803 family)
VTGGANGSGTVFKVDPTGHDTVLYSFAYSGTLANHYSGLTLDAAGNLYGTAARGGSGADVGCVFKIDASGNESVLYAFTGGLDGSNPYSGLISDAAGNLYGTASAGGSNKEGVVYKVNPAGVETVLYSFRGAADGANPRSILTADGAGNFYGTTLQGGFSGAGVVFKIDPSGHETVLYNFTGGLDGGSPYAGVLSDGAGNLYGTTSAGGSGNVGVVYKLDATGVETILYSFAGGLDGGSPYSGLIAGPGGILYGTAYGIGANPPYTSVGPNAGVVYKLKPAAAQ